MVISGFSLCFGYYERIINGEISLGEFYKKRFTKVWPFFALLCILDLIVSPSVDAFYEVLANLTLCFGLIPNANISVIGVGWFLGLVFVFYFLFPFVCWLLSDKKRAWVSFLVALLLNALSTVYFGADRTSIAYSGVFFLAGGLIFVYRDELRKLADQFSWVLLIVLVGMLAVYYVFGLTGAAMLIISALILVLALRTPRRKVTLLSNPVTKKLGDLSLELYLSHMVIFRLLEKLKLTKLTACAGLDYLIASIGTILGTLLFSLGAKKILSLLNDRVVNYKKKREIENV
jgi:peptidoglycan/LPS O-acetylase OafA/YrhL